MKRVLVTGASGFVGTHLIEALLQNKENEIYAAVFGRGESLKEMLPAGQIISGDLTDSAFTLQLIKDVRPDVIYHLAALSVVEESVEKAGKTLTSNVLLQYNILEAVRQHVPQSRFIAICSANEYGLVKESDIPIDEDTPLRPLNPYAVSKAAQDLLAYQYSLSYGLDIVRLRPFNHTGEGQTTNFVIPALVKQFVEIKQGKREAKIEIGNTESIRDFTDVKDMVQAYIIAAEKCQAGEVYNIGFGKGSTVGEIIELLQAVSGTKVEIIKKSEKMRPSDVPILIADSTKFRNLTGWEPQIKLKDTLARVYNYMYVAAEGAR